MMNKQASKKAKIQTLDLATLDGEGSFPCPCCGIKISPDDETEEAYKIVDTKLIGDELVELVVRCGSCGTTIRLSGFEHSIET